jgi:transcriptional regulator with XRE-family HTH domain
MTTFERIKQLADKQKISLKTLATNLGFSENYFYNMKNAKSSPSSDALLKVADYFHVSVDYLLGREDIEKIKEPVDLKDIVSDHVNFEDVNWDEWLSFGGKPLTEKDKMLLFATFYNRDEK